MNIRRRLAYLGYLAAITGAVVALDQWTKALVRARLALGESWNPVEWLQPYINITHWTNTGMAFGQFKSGGQLLTVVGFAVSGVIIWYYWGLPQGQWLVRTALGMQLGGALGNLVDRLNYGSVTDFIEVTHSLSRFRSVTGVGQSESEIYSYRDSNNLYC